MARPDRIEGTAIVSADGMIADAQGVQPKALWLNADQRVFRDMLNKATALAHGRHSREGGPQAAGRRRLILTRRIAGVARDPQSDKIVHWNPAAAPSPSPSARWRSDSAADKAVCVSRPICSAMPVCETSLGSMPMGRRAPAS